MVEYGRLIGSLVPLLETFVKVRGKMDATQEWWRKAEAAVGRLGPAYCFVWKLPFVLLKALIYLIIALSVTAFCTGLFILQQTSAGVGTPPAQWYNFPGWKLLVSLYEWGWLVLTLSYAVLGVVIVGNFLPSGMRLLARAWSAVRPAIRYSPGYVNAVWQLHFGKNAIPVNVDTESCDRMALAIAEELNSGPASWQTLRAIPPVGVDELGVDERANLLLIGNVIEGGIHRQGLTPPKWRDFYANLARAAALPARPFAWDGLDAQGRDKGFYSFLRTLDPAHPELFPSSVAIENDVDATVALLCRRYSGNAARLIAPSWWTPFRKPSLRRARRRLKTFPRMNHHDSRNMAPQFLKLAVRWNVWPSIKAGPQIFASRDVPTAPRGLVRLLLESTCLLTPPDAKLIGNDDHIKRLVVRAEQEIAQRVGCIVRESSSGELVAIAQDLSTPGHGGWDFRLFEFVDYFLWQASQPQRRVAAPAGPLNPPAAWDVNETRLTRT